MITKTFGRRLEDRHIEHSASSLDFEGYRSGPPTVVCLPSTRLDRSAALAALEPA
jgi:hypothetical protein